MGNTTSSVALWWHQTGVDKTLWDMGLRMDIYRKMTFNCLIQLRWFNESDIINTGLGSNFPRKWQPDYENSKNKYFHVLELLGWIPIVWECEVEFPIYNSKPIVQPFIITTFSKSHYIFVTLLIIFGYCLKVWKWTSFLVRFGRDCRLEFQSYYTPHCYIVYLRATCGTKNMILILGKESWS